MVVRLLLALAFVVALGVPLLAKPAPANALDCGFTLGFKTLHDLIPTAVGDCLVDEHHDNGIGDSLQVTMGPAGAGGLLVWRKADNWTAYTDGNRTWINGPFGLEARFNPQRFLWELGGATTDWVAESNAEHQICATLPADATRELVADCWVIVQKQKVQALVAQYTIRLVTTVASIQARAFLTNSGSTAARADLSAPTTHSPLGHHWFSTTRAS